MDGLQENDWISALEAVRIAYNKSGRTMEKQILQRARDGIIQAKASHYIVSGPKPKRHPYNGEETEEQRYTSHLIPTEFFSIGEAEVFVSNWTTGDFSTCINHTWNCRAYGVQFLRSQIEQMFPTVSVSSEYSIPLPKHKDGELEEWMRAAPKMTADAAHYAYKQTARFNGIKQTEFRTMWQKIKGTRRGKSKSKP